MAQALEYDVRPFEAGSGWLVYEGPIDVALQILGPEDPECHEVGEIVLLFDRHDQLGNDALIESAAVAGIGHDVELFRELGGNASSRRSVAGLVVGVGAVDLHGRITGESRVSEAMVSSRAGETQLWVRRNDFAAADNGEVEAIIAERDRSLASLQSLDTAFDGSNDDDRAAEIAAIRAVYDAALRISEANVAELESTMQLDGGEHSALVGGWSSSQEDCANERLILYERAGSGVVEWWRLSDQDIGLQPRRTGRWE